MPTQLVIGVTGRMASGKGSVAKYLIESQGAIRFRASDPLRATLDTYAVPQTRTNLQLLSTFLRSAYGETILIDTIIRTIRAAGVSLTVFDGIRRVVDIEQMRSFPNFRFIFVDADQQTRYQRYVERNENPGDAPMTLEHFIAEDTAEPEQQIDQLKNHADFIVDNSGTKEQFTTQLREIIDQIISTQTHPSAIENSKE